MGSPREATSALPAGTGPSDGSLDRVERLRPHTARAGVVRRGALIDRLCDVDGGHVVNLVAPAGYGKSTAAAQWMESDVRPGAWLTIGRPDNDPAILLSEIGVSLTQAGLLSEEDRSALRFSSKTALSHGVWELARRIGESTPGLLILDQAEDLSSQASRDVLAELAVRLPNTITLAVASRSDVGLPVGTLRSRGELVELSANDLAMNGPETRALASHVGIDIDDSVIDVLLERTEGWPVGLYLMMLAVKSGTPPQDLLDIRGDDAFLAEYMQSELLAGATPDQVSFLMQTSVLEDLSGPLCDFVLERTGSSPLLDTLASSNLLIVPLDHRRRGYRFHPLFREFLHAEQRRRDPESLPELHRRAASWYEAHGMTNRAIHHAMAAGDEDATAGLVARSARNTFAAGHADTVRGWLAWFEEADRSPRYPAIALLAVMAYASIGDVEVTQRHSPVVMELADQPSGPLVPMAKIARGLLCPAGIAQVHRDGLEAREALTPASEWYPAALSIEGIGLLWSGETNAADANFALAAEMGERFSAAPASVFTLATRSAIASERAEYDEASTLASHALRLVRQLGMERYATSVLSFVVAARAMRRRGDPAEARRLLNQASALRPLLTVALPVVSVQTLLEMAEARLEFGDAGGARQMLREVADILHERPGLGGLEDRFTTLRERLAEVPAARSAASTLTNAELRLLPLLVTHLSFPEIGERLYISRHTVKTQAMSIYRKLGSSSRSEAVQVAREMHLLDV